VARRGVDVAIGRRTRLEDAGPGSSGANNKSRPDAGGSLRPAFVVLWCVKPGRAILGLPADREVTVDAMDRPEQAPLPCDATVCERCAAVGPTCCTLQLGEEELCFPVSEMERQRIIEYGGLLHGAFTLEANSGAFRSNLRRLFPGEQQILNALFPETGQHLRLSCDAAGNCVFLRADGCSLPRAARPYYCRLFPFWFFGSRLTAFVAAGCLAHQPRRNLPEILSLFDCTEAQMRELHGRLRLAWGLPPKEGMSFVTPSPARFDS